MMTNLLSLPFSHSPPPSVSLSHTFSVSLKKDKRLRIYMSFALAHSGQIMSASSVMNPRPTKDVLQLAHEKQSLCQCRSSNEMKRVPPIPWSTMVFIDSIYRKLSKILHFFDLPVIGFVHDVHLLAKSSPKQSAQYGWSSRLVKRWPANEVEQWVHVKHSRCHGSFLYVTPPEVIIWKVR